jgi:predicted GIY-YIG superfamily endonuclease
MTREIPSPWTVYILICADASLYTGVTNDLDARVKKHAAGTGAKYTRGRGPLRLVYQESHATQGDALRREAAIKRLTRAEKARLIEEGGAQPAAAAKSSTS